MGGMQALLNTPSPFPPQALVSGYPAYMSHLPYMGMLQSVRAISLDSYTCYVSLMVYTINSGVQVQVLLFGDCAFLWHRLCGVLIIMGYFSTRLNIW